MEKITTAATAATTAAASHKQQSSVPRISINTCSNLGEGKRAVRKGSMPTTSAETEALRGSCPDLCDDIETLMCESAINNPAAAAMRRQHIAAAVSAVAEGVRQLSVYCSPRATRRTLHDEMKGKFEALGLVDEEVSLSAEVAFLTTLALFKSAKVGGDAANCSEDSGGESQRSASRLSTCAPSDFTGAVSWEGGLGYGGGGAEDLTGKNRHSSRFINLQSAGFINNNNSSRCSSRNRGNNSYPMSSFRRLRRTNSNPENLLVTGKNGAYLKDSRSCTNLQRHAVQPSTMTTYGDAAACSSVSMTPTQLPRSLLEQQQEEDNDNSFQVYIDVNGLSPLSPFPDVDGRGNSGDASSASCHFRIAQLNNSSADHSCSNSEKVRQWLQGLDPSISSCTSDNVLRDLSNCTSESVIRDISLVST